VSPFDAGPVRHIDDGVIWLHGQPGAWAVYEAASVGCLLAGQAGRRSGRRAVEAALRACPSMQILGVASPQPVRDVIVRQGGTVDGFGLYDRWAAGLAGDDPDWWERSYWLICRLRQAETLTDLVRRHTSDQWARTRGLVAAPPNRTERDRAAGDAAALAARLELDARPATASEIEWLCARRFDPALPRPADRHCGRRVVLWADTVLEQRPADRAVWIHPGAGPSVAAATLVVEGSPADRFDPDTNESGDAGLIARAEAGIGVWPLDWCVRIWQDPKDATLLTWRARHLAHGVKAGDTVDVAGADEGERKASDDVQELRTELAHNRGPELRVVTTFTVWSDGHGDHGRALGEVDDRCAEVQKLVGGGWPMVRPPGDQERLLTAQVPGVTLPVGVADWADHLLPAGVASFGMFAGGEPVGDFEGLLLGRACGSALGEARYWDPSRAPRAGVDAKPSLSIIGESGAGKSSFAKGLVLAGTARGWKAIVIDPSPHGEWADVGRAARPAGWTAEVVRPEQGGVSIDPLRILPPSMRVDAAVQTLCSLGSVEAGSEEAAVVRETVERTAHLGGGLGDVIEFLNARSGNDPVGRGLGRRLGGLARHQHARCLFDPTLRPVDTTASLVVIALNDLSLPDPTAKRSVMEGEIVGQLEAAAQMLRRPGDPEVLDTLPGLPTGRFFFADLAGRVGVVQGQLAPFAPIRDAVDTSVRVEVVA
jgi:hypothetical protein